VVDREKVERKIQQLEAFLGFLKKLSQSEDREVTVDPIRLGSIKYYLQVSIESCIDMANHLISSERLRSPRDYADSFAVLSEYGIISKEFAQVMQQMAKFRNRIVHLYGEVDDRQVLEILQQRLGDFEIFKRAVGEFLKKAE
jgi:uncharacterized protein YutE (UPF0331/DUF86 family)